MQKNSFKGTLIIFFWFIELFIIETVDSGAYFLHISCISLPVSGSKYHMLKCNFVIWMKLQFFFPRKKKKLTKPINFFRIGGHEIFNHFLRGDEFFENRGKNELKKLHRVWYIKNNGDKPVGVRPTGKPQVVKTTEVTSSNLGLPVGPWLRDPWAYRKVIAVADEDSSPCHASTIPSWLPLLPF